MVSQVYRVENVEVDSNIQIIFLIIIMRGAKLYLYFIMFMLLEEGPEFVLIPEEVAEQATACNKKKKAAKLAGVSE